MFGKKKKKETGKKKTARRKTASKPTQTKKSELFKFRRYKKPEGKNGKKAKHPKLIVDQTEKEFSFMGLTESEKSGHHKNIALENNPRKGDDRAAYLRKELRHDKKSNFGEILNDYNLSEKDKKKVIGYIEKLKKRSNALR